MQMTPFPAHYQLIYTNFVFSSFSRISCIPKQPLLKPQTGSFARQYNGYWKTGEEAPSPTPHTAHLPPCRFGHTARTAQMQKS